MSETAEIVVIGAGAFGASVAYHLARAGQRGVILLDRFAIGSQTSPRAAGLTQQIRPDTAMTRLAMRSVEKLVGFSDETGLPLEFQQAGSVKMARTPADEAQVAAEIAAGAALGLDIRPLAAGDLEALAPWARSTGVRAMWFTPSDLYLEPGQIPLRYAEAAAQSGAMLRPHTGVTGLLRDGDRITGVETEQGPIAAGLVVDAAGAWARRVAEQAGMRIPVVPVRHQLFITEALPEVAADQPICRVTDANVYVRPAAGGLMLGGYEANPRAYDMERVGDAFQIADLALDVAVLRHLAEGVREQFPALPAAALREHRGGLPTMTADGRHLVGPVPGIDGFFAVTGCCVGGLSISPGMGEMVAERIITGESAIPLASMAIDRFAGASADDAALEAACLHAYAHHYAEGWQAARV